MLGKFVVNLQGRSYATFQRLYFHSIYLEGIRQFVRRDRRGFGRIDAALDEKF